MNDILNREKGPVEILCKEIGWRGFFDHRLETQAILIAFVRELVSHVADMRAMQTMVAEHTGGKPPSDESASLLVKVGALLSLKDREMLLAYAAEVHDFIHQIEGPEDGPCDHLTDMLSSCVLAIRFSLEKPCRSRHAANAASHVWKHRYGVSLFDGFTSAWEHDWARAQLASALLAEARA